MRSIQGAMLAKLFSKVTIPSYIHAFEKRKSIPVMAQIHTGKRLVISIDLEDFFTTITQKTIVKCMSELGMADAPARTVSELCTYKFFVPQGGLTSPKVSNLVTSMTFGPEVKAYCAAENFDLTIYADDITISTNVEGFIDVPKVLRDIKEIVKKEGFRVNHAKTKVMWRTSRQYVCGVVVNEKTNLLRKQRLALRAIVHNIEVNGLEAEAAKNELAAGEFESQLKGKLNWFSQLNPTLGNNLKTKFNNYLEARQYQNDAEERIQATITPPSEPIEINTLW